MNLLRLRAIVAVGLVVFAAPLYLSSAEEEQPPPPPSDGGLDGSGDALADATPNDLPPPPADPRDFEGVWLPAMGGGGPPGAGPRGSGAPGARGGPPGAGPPGGGPPPGNPGTLFCEPVERLRGAGGGMSNFWTVGEKIAVMISEEDMDVRKIYIDGEHPKDLIPQPNGHSIGKWEGNVLVVDTVGFSDGTGKLKDQHVVERIRKEGNNGIWYLVRDFEITSGGNKRSMTARDVWRPDLRFYENVCEENAFRFSMQGGQVKVSPLSAPTPAGK